MTAGAFLLQDEIWAPWEDTLDFNSFALRVPRSELHRLPQILRAVSEDRVREMQEVITRVWERFSYSSLGLAEAKRRCGAEPSAARHRAECIGGRDAKTDLRRWVTKPLKERITGRDAIDTLMLVLQVRLEITRDHGGLSQYILPQRG
jgi:hypothetical protein